MRLADFLTHLPVRRQSALRSSVKSLGKIKTLLQAYALARPTVRISLKVLKSRSDRGYWAYAATDDAGVLDAARQVVGIECAGACSRVSHAWEQHEAGDESRCFRVEALLPTSDAGMRRRERSERALMYTGQMRG